MKRAPKGSRETLGARCRHNRAIKNQMSCTPLIESRAAPFSAPKMAGKTWEERDRSNWMVWRPFYFANLIVDPKNENKVYKPDLTLIMSEDGGKSFSGIGNGAHGDFHDVWVNPDNTDHVIAGDDGGVWYSYDGGNTWWKGNNLPISQFYHVSADNADPYHVFGGLQDKQRVDRPTRSIRAGLPTVAGKVFWEETGSGYFPIRPTPTTFTPNSQGGFIGRVNRFTLEGRLIKPEAKLWRGETALQLEHSDPY